MIPSRFDLWLLLIAAVLTGATLAVVVGAGR